MILANAIRGGWVGIWLAGCGSRQDGTPPTDTTDAEPATDTDRDGWTEVGGDCDDHNAGVHPSAPERCNRIDDDCDGLIDGNDPDMPADLLSDADGDGYRGTPTNYCGEDCDDGNASIHPGALEVVCDGVDSNCDSGGVESFVVGSQSAGTLEQALLLAGPGDEILVCPGAHDVGSAEVSALDGVLRSYSGSPEDTALVSGLLSGVGTLVMRDLTLQGVQLQWQGPLAIEGSTFDASTVDVEYSGTASSEPGVVVRNSTFRDLVYDLNSGSPIAARIDDGSLLVEGCDFHGNQVDVGGTGGAIDLTLSDATALISTNVFEYNFDTGVAGAIGVYADAGNNVLSITASTFRGNLAYSGGGAVDGWVWEDAALALKIDSSTFEENWDGAVKVTAYYASAELDVAIHDSVFARNGGTQTGGALEVLGSARVDLEILRSEFDGNMARGGGCSQIQVDGRAGVVSIEDTHVRDAEVWDFWRSGGVCTVGFFSSDTAISWSGGSVLGNEQYVEYVSEAGPEWVSGGLGVLYLGLGSGNTASFDNVAFGTDADANQPRDIYECTANPHVGTITADLNAANPCP